MDKEAVIESEHKTSSNPNWMSGFHIICAIAGAGVLGLPHSMAKVGWISIVFLVMIAIMTYYTSVLLIECLYYKKGQRLQVLPDIGYEAFGVPGRTVVQFGHYITCLFSVILYLILSGIFFHGVFGGLSEKNWILIAGVIVAVPFCFMKTIKEANILGIFGVLTTYAAIITAVIFSLSVNKDIKFLNIETNTFIKYQSIEFIDFPKIPSVLAILSFAFGGSVVFPHVELHMKDKKSFNKTLLYSILIIAVSYLLIGIVTASVYGKNIFDNIIQHLKVVHGVYVVIALSVTFHVLLASPIYLSNAIVDLEDYLNITVEQHGKLKELLFRIPLRLAVITILTIIGYFVPHFFEVAAVIGAICNALIVFLVPCICHLKLYGVRNRKTWEYFAISITIILGLFCFVWGTYDSIYALIEKINKRI